VALASLLILLVDDDELALEITGLQLAAIGHSVWKAPSGARALEQLSQAMLASARLPDAILTDMQMPDMDGASLCKKIRALGGMPLKVFAMSATRLSDDTLRDFDGFVLKPLDLGALRGILEAKLEPQKMPPVSGGQVPVMQMPVLQMPEPALDAAILKKLRVLMPPDALDELLNAYLSDTRIRLTQMERYADTGDYQALRSCAHMIKGSASMAGASRVARIASQLESGEVVPEHQKILFNELRCACDAIEGTLAREDRLKEAHDHQNSRIG
jgi:CheY-like chemotaxis protein